MASASSVVPFMSDGSGSLVLKQLNLSAESRKTLERGLSYLQGSDVEKWVEKRRGDFDNIVRTVRESAKVHAQLDEIGERVRDANCALGAIEKERESVEVDEKEENGKFEQATTGLSKELETVRDGLRDENRIALFAFNNPLTSKAGRLVASLGRYTFDASVALLGVLHRDTLAQNCSQVLSATVTTASQCASTVAQSSVYVPLLIAGGLTYLCHKAYTVGTRIMKQQRKAEEIQGQIDADKQRHSEKIGQLAGQKEKLKGRNAENRAVIEQSEKNRTELDLQRSRNDSVLGRIRDKLIGDIGNREIAQVEKTFSYPADIAQEVGAKSMQNFFDAMLAGYSDQQQKLASIGSADAPLQIAAAKSND